MSESVAPNWDAGQGLTWSGKWHILRNPASPPVPPVPPFGGTDIGLCGTYVYTRANVPTYVARLQSIARGLTKAPVCKKCERAARRDEVAS